MKVLVAVAAPEESRTTSAPLDVEAEMQAVLDATAPVAGHPSAQVRVLEVASPTEITEALATGGFHVLHLSAHGSATTLELLENEDGDPLPTDATTLLDALRLAGRSVPLIVLSSCHGGSADADSLALHLVRHGADRVLAMQAEVTDGYATDLAAALYTQLASQPDRPVAAALATARQARRDEAAASTGTSRSAAPTTGVRRRHAVCRKR